METSFHTERADGDVIRGCFEIEIDPQLLHDRYVAPALEAMKRGQYPPFLAAWGAFNADLEFAEYRRSLGLPEKGVFTHGGPHS